jgi:RNA polymerase sigma factor for flagellar operon FliA
MIPGVMKSTLHSHEESTRIQVTKPASELTEGERQKIILDYYPLVRTIAARMIRRFPTNVELDELVSEGILGLMDALERFNPERGVPFKSYAEIRVRGAIVDALRHQDFVPRSVRRKWQALEREKDRLFLKLKRKPTREEMARSLQMDIQSYDVYVEDSRIYRLISGDAFLDDESSETVMSTVSSSILLADEEILAEEQWGDVGRLVGKLPDKEKKVILLYYIKTMNLKNIGEQLGVTESRVCQLRGQAIRRIQQWMREEEELEQSRVLESRAGRDILAEAGAAF